MSNNLFRKKSLERISSPEQLNDYIRVSTPSVWMVLIAVVVLLTGVCVWGVAGHMDTVLSCVAIAQEGTMTAYVREENISQIKMEAAVTVNDAAVSILAIDAQPVQVDDAFTGYARHVGGLQLGEWVYAVTLDANCPDGVYTAQIVTDSVSPMSFVLN